MPIINAPFRPPFEGSSVARPYLPIEVINPHSKISRRWLGLIDTGADECAFPAAYGKLLGHSLEKGIKKPCVTANGLSIAYQHTVIITIPGFSTTETLVDFIDGLDTVLLGVRSFLCHFKLTVDYPKSQFSLRKK